MRRITSLRALALAVAVLSTMLVVAPSGAQPRPGSVKDYLLSRPVAVMQPELEQALADAEPTDRLGILVQVKDTELRDSDVLMLTAMGFVPVVRFEILPVAFTTGTPAQIRELAARDRVRRIELNKRLDYHLNRSTKTIKADQGVWDRYLKEADRIRLPIDGHGVTVAVIDSGVDATHPDLKLGEKTVANKKFIGESVLGFTEAEPHGEIFEGIGLWVDVPDSDNTSVHGTHVAGIAAGSGEASQNSAGLGYAGAEATNRRGTAPGAKIFGLGAGEAILVLNALSAFDFIYHELKDRGNPFNIRVINNSWGGAGEFDPDSFVSQAVMVLSYDMDQYAPPGKRFNQHVVFSAGNDGDDGAGGVDYDTNSLWARIPVSIGVANTSKNGLPPNDAGNTSTAMNSSSSRGVVGRPETFPNVAAPGTGIVSALAHGHWGTPYVPLSGTSMSAPHVAGVIALMLEANPDLRVSSVPEDFTPTSPAAYQDPFLNRITEAEWILKATANPVAGFPGDRIAGAAYLPGKTTSPHDGYGLIDAEMAVATALALRKLRRTNPAATVSDAVAAAPSLVENVDETHQDVDELETAWWGRSFTWGTPAITVPSTYTLTVPANFEALKLTLRWDELADLDLNLLVPLAAGGTSSADLTELAPPTENGFKEVVITPETTSPNIAGAVFGDPSRPWTVRVDTEALLALMVDWQVTAELKVDGTWTVARDSTTGVANGADVVRKWGDWYPADNGNGQFHVESDTGDGYTVAMRYYNLDGSTVEWSDPGTAPNGSSKWDPKAPADDPDVLPTRKLHLSYDAWTSWHQALDEVVLPPPPPSALVLQGATSGQYTDTVTVGARLSQGNTALAGRTVTFTLGAQSAAATTGPDGVAQVSLPLLQPPAAYTLVASYDGETGIPPASVSAPFDIRREDSSLAFSLGQSGTDALLTATLSETDTPATKLGGRTVSFLRDGSAVGTATTGPDGVATLTVSGAGAGSYSASFAGDSFYLGAASGAASFPIVGGPVITAPLEGALLRVRDVTVSGTGTPGSTVTVSEGSTPLFSAVANSSGAWSGVASFADGPHTITAVATKDGHTSPTSAPRSFTVDTTVAISITRVPDPIQDVHVDHVTVSGTATPGAGITVVLDDGTVTSPAGTAVADASGLWTSTGIDARGLANGPVTVTATASFPGGGSATATRTVTKDTSGIPPQVLIRTGDFDQVLDPARVPIVVTYKGPLSSTDVTVTVTDEHGGLIEVGTVSGLGLGQSQTLYADLSSLRDGRVTATAYFGSTLALDSAILDRTKPTVTIDTPDLVYLSVPFIFSNVAFSGTATDAGSGVAYVAIRLKEGSRDVLVTSRANGEPSTTWEADFTNLDLLPGFYTVEAVSFDRAGNPSAKATETVLVI